MNKSLLRGRHRHQYRPDAEDLARWDVQPDGGEYFTTFRNISTGRRSTCRCAMATPNLNATDPTVAELAELCDGEVIFFAADPACPAMAAHLADDKRGVFVRGGRITLATGSNEIRLAASGDVPVIGKQKAPRRCRTCWRPPPPAGRSA